MIRGKRFTLNTGTVCALIIAFYAVYYILLCDNFPHISVASILAYSRQLPLTKHLVILGLIPIYIAAMLFGAAMLGIYLGARLQSVIDKRRRLKA
jgi:hypothetical protein